MKFVLERNNFDKKLWTFSREQILQDSGRKSLCVHYYLLYEIYNDYMDHFLALRRREGNFC